MIDASPSIRKMVGAVNDNWHGAGGIARRRVGPYLRVATPLKYGSNHFDWKLSTDYRFSPEVMGYATVSTGFRSDGAQPRPFTPAQQKVPTDAEELASYEVGLKSDLLDRRLRINIAAFLDSYEPRVLSTFGAQCNLPTDATTGPLFLGIDGAHPCPAGTPMAGTAGVPWAAFINSPGRDKGLEVEFSATPVDNLIVNGSLSLFDYTSKAAKTLPSGAPNPAYVDPSYKLQAPISGSLGAQYRFKMARGALTPRIDWFYQGYRSNGVANLPQLSGSDNKVPGYGLVNARLTYAPEGSKWTVAFAAENLLDKFYWYQLQSARNTETGLPTEIRTGAPARGRELSLTLQRNFD